MSCQFLHHLMLESVLKTESWLDGTESRTYLFSSCEYSCYHIPQSSSRPQRQAVVDRIDTDCVEALEVDVETTERAEINLGSVSTIGRNERDIVFRSNLHLG